MNLQVARSAFENYQGLSFSPIDILTLFDEILVIIGLRKLKIIIKNVYNTLEYSYS